MDSVKKYTQSSRLSLQLEKATEKCKYHKDMSRKVTFMYARLPQFLFKSIIFKILHFIITNAHSNKQKFYQTKVNVLLSIQKSSPISYSSKESKIALQIKDLQNKVFSTQAAYVKATEELSTAQNTQEKLMNAKTTPILLQTERSGSTDRAAELKQTLRSKQDECDRLNTKIQELVESGIWLHNQFQDHASASCEYFMISAAEIQLLKEKLVKSRSSKEMVQIAQKLIALKENITKPHIHDKLPNEAIDVGLSEEAKNELVMLTNSVISHAKIKKALGIK